jgi:hypothetical protein
MTAQVKEFNRQGRVLLLLVLLAGGLAMMAPVGRSAAVVNGVTASPTPSWAVGLVTSSGDIYCSGVLVAANLVLTAKHCTPGGRDRVVIGRSALQNGGEGSQVAVTHTIDHPQEDLSIAVLDRSVGQAPLSIGSGDPSSDQMSFIPFTLYGYGRTNEVTESPPVYDGYLRTAVGLVSGCDSRSGVGAPRFCLKPQSIQSPCRADSGAPLVASGHLIGIFTSFFWVGQEKCVGSDWVATSVTNTAVKQWVNDTITANPPS